MFGTLRKNDTIYSGINEEEISGFYRELLGPDLEEGFNPLVALTAGDSQTEDRMVIDGRYNWRVLKESLENLQEELDRHEIDREVYGGWAHTLGSLDAYAEEMDLQVDRLEYEVPMRESGLPDSRCYLSKPIV